jgi:hypothetical protein
MGGSDEEKFDHPTQKPVELMRALCGLRWALGDQTTTSHTSSMTSVWKYITGTGHPQAYTGTEAGIMALAPARACFRFYAELNDHLPPGERYRTLEKEFFVPASVKDMIGAKSALGRSLRIMMREAKYGASEGFHQL